MNVKISSNRLRIAFAMCFAAALATAVLPAVTNIAVVTGIGSKLTDVSLADLAKLCKGAQKAWPDGKSFTLVIKDPAAPSMRVSMQKLFGATTADALAVITKLNDSRHHIKVVSTDDDLFRTVAATPGAVGLVDVYSINSSVKVLRVDGKLPFDAGYALKGN